MKFGHKNFVRGCERHLFELPCFAVQLRLSDCQLPSLRRSYH
jgi:hypothetical protein